jgi:hypothetical protein
MDLNFFASPDNKDRFHWSFIYFHGSIEEVTYNKIEELNRTDAPDIVTSDVDLKYVQDGIYDASCYGIKVKAFIWTAKSIRRGLIIDIKDSKELEYATKMFNEKSYSL